MPRAWRAVLAVATILVAAVPVHGDWLVTNDGARIETKGPWKVKGSQVVFRQLNGTLSALRVGDVDLDASSVATARAVEAATATPAPAPKPPRPPILRLTDKDLPPVTEEAGAVGSEKDKAAEGRPEPLVVSSWDRVDLPDGGGVEIFGNVTNQGGALVTAATVAVTLYDADGGILVTESADLATAAIPPGKSSTFRVQFPGVVSFETAKFAVASQGFREMTNAPEEGEAAPVPEAEAAPPSEESTP